MAEPPREDTARAAGRGGLAVAAAKVYFILLGFVQQTVLTRVLGAEGYGAFSSVLAIANVADNVVITSSIQGASRTVAEAKPENEPGARRGVLVLHAKLALPLALLFFFAGPAIAELTGAPHIVPHLRVASLVVLGYALYTPLVGTLNGRRRFVAQALLDTTYATLRTIAMIGGGWLLLRAGKNAPFGAVAGFACAALLIVPVATKVAGLGAKGPGAPRASEYFRLLAPLAAGQLFLNTLLQGDLTLLRYFASNASAAAGLVGEAAADAADRSIGIYKACQLFSVLPYQLLVSITFILFPMLAKAGGEGDAEAVQSYVRTGMRLACVLTGAMVAVICGVAPGLLHLVFKPEIADVGARTLRILAIGQGAFAVYAIETTVLSSLHRERWTMILNATGTALLAVAAFVFVPGSPNGAPIAERAAMATTAALSVSLVLGGIAVVRRTGALVSWLSAIRVAVATGLAIAVGLHLPVRGKAMTLACGAAVAAAYLVALVLLREIRAADVTTVKRIIRPKA